jgi:hypothetical protein
MNNLIPRGVESAASLYAKCADGDRCILIRWSEPRSAVTVKLGDRGVLVPEGYVMTKHAFIQYLKDQGYGHKLTSELEAELIEKTHDYRIERDEIGERPTPDD